MTKNWLTDDEDFKQLLSQVTNLCDLCKEMRQPKLQVCTPTHTHTHSSLHTPPTHTHPHSSPDRSTHHPHTHTHTHSGPDRSTQREIDTLMLTQTITDTHSHV